MSVLNPLFAFTILLISFITAYVLHLKYKITHTNSRFETIDSLRGFLAIFVFIHHACLWHQYFQIDRWDVPPSNFFNQIGQTSVVFFFMITSYLFVTKLLNTEEHSFDFRAFFLSRIFRLVPMYLVSVAILVIIVFSISNWELMTGKKALLHTLSDWGLFTMFHAPQINNQALTSQINAGVVWSLPYEWLFYFSLPFISLLISSKKPKFIFLLIGWVLIYLINNNLDIKNYHLYSFMGGAIAPFIQKYAPSKFNFDNIFVSIFIVLCLLYIGHFLTANLNPPKIAAIIIFTFIALGNTFFGILKSTTLKFMGEISYSTYLIHGIVMFVSYYFLVGFDKMKLISETKYCLLVFALTPIIVIISFITYRLIEKPGIAFGKKLLLSETIPKV
jgi:peptidoglycan/LPS O-acetylase OafA/YrhL